MKNEIAEWILKTYPENLESVQMSYIRYRIPETLYHQIKDRASKNTPGEYASSNLGFFKSVMDDLTDKQLVLMIELLNDIEGSFGWNLAKSNVRFTLNERVYKIALGLLPRFKSDFEMSVMKSKSENYEPFKNIYFKIKNQRDAQLQKEKFEKFKSDFVEETMPLLQSSGFPKEDSDYLVVNIDRQPDLSRSHKHDIVEIRDPWFKKTRSLIAALRHIIDDIGFVKPYFINHYAIINNNKIGKLQRGHGCSESDEITLSVEVIHPDDFNKSKSYSEALYLEYMKQSFKRETKDFINKNNLNNAAMVGLAMVEAFERKSICNKQPINKD